MADVRRISGLGELTEFVDDRTELSKGAQLFDAQQIKNLARFENRLFADAQGSGAAPYKVSITFGEARTDVKGRCSCMAARSRPFCKHATALLVAWSRSPEAFVTADAPPVAPSAGGAAKKSVKKGKAETADLMKAGVEQVSTLIRELALSGVASVSAERPDQVRGLGEALRANGLRRLSARTLELASLLEFAAARTGAFPAATFADLLADMLLTTRKIEKHLAGEALDNRYVEELIGKTWTKKDRAPIEHLSLVEYAFITRTTPDNFIIRESRFVDLTSGKHYSEKQIVPAFLKRADPKKSHAGLLLEDASAGLYPGFAPLRIDLAEELRQTPLTNDALERLLQIALPDVGAALSAFQEHRKDVFAPELFPVTVKVENLLASGARPQLVDEADRALFLPDDPALEEALAGALQDVKLRAVLGDIRLEGALPTLTPAAVLVETSEGLELRSVRTAEDEQLPRRGNRLPIPQSTAGARGSWAEAARAVGASRAAVALAEVRDDLADRFASGLPGINPRAVEPLSARLKELGLEKPAALLDATAQKPDPSDRLDDFVKVYQVLEIALVRLAGAVQVDRGTLEPVSSHPSVQVRRPEPVFAPGEVIERRARGELSRFDAAAHYARYFEDVGAEELLRELYPSWADGLASEFVARTIAVRGPEALEAARGALAPHHSRMVQRTAVRVLARVGGTGAEELLEKTRLEHEERGIRAAAVEALEELRAVRNPDATGRIRRERKERIETLARRALNAPHKDERMNAIGELAGTGSSSAFSPLRQVLHGDPVREVRRLAGVALASLGDQDVLDWFVRLLEARAEYDDDAKDVAYALGTLGDVRGVPALLSAFLEGWKPGVISEALRTLGPAVVLPTLELVESRPEVLERKALLTLFGSLPAQELEACLLARIEANLERAEFPRLCGLWLKIAAARWSLGKAMAARVQQLPAAMADKGVRRLVSRIEKT